MKSHGEGLHGPSPEKKHNQMVLFFGFYDFFLDTVTIEVLY
jgi:hypothetical protein